MSTPEPQPGFWRGVRQDALAGIVVLAVGSAGAGIFYLCYTVPTKLDDLLTPRQLAGLMTSERGALLPFSYNKLHGYEH